MAWPGSLVWPYFLALPGFAGPCGSVSWVMDLHQFSADPTQLAAMFYVALIRDWGRISRADRDVMRAPKDQVCLRHSSFIAVSWMAWSQSEGCQNGRVNGTPSG